MAHQRFRRFNTGSFYPEQKITNEMCMARTGGSSAQD
jgi:hypothetical protein